MLDVILGRASRRCDGVSRRDFLRVGALGGLGLTLPALLASEARAGRAARARAKSVLLVYLGGGMSHHDTFDPKPEAPAEVRGQYKPIAHLPARRADQRKAAADGESTGPHQPRALRLAQQRPPRDRHQLGAVRPLRLGLRRLPGDGRRGGLRAGLPRPAAALRRRAAQPVVHVGAGKKRLSRRPLRVVQGRRPQRGRTTRCRTSAPTRT